MALDFDFKEQGCSMNICEFGDRSHPHILYIPGLFMSGVCLESIASKLTQYHFVCVTLDGYDGSGEEFEGLEKECRKLIARLEESGFLSFELVMGMSLGTIFAVELARSSELTIRKIFLDGAVNFYTSGAAFFERMAMNHIFSGYIKKAVNREKVIANLSRSFIGNWPEEMQKCMAGLTEQSKEAMIEVLVNYQIKPGLTQPMYCLYGSRETNLQVNVRAIKKYYPNVMIQIVKGYNHLVYANQEPEAYARIIQAFMISTKEM